jgi:hypothetical protein
VAYFGQEPEIVIVMSMRHYLPVLLLALGMGCHKSSQPPLASGPATLQFTVNGTVYQMNGNLTDSSVGVDFVGHIGGCVSTETMYYLQGEDAAGNSFVMGTEPITSLKVATYRDSLTEIRSTCFNAGGTVKLINILSSTPFALSTQADYSIITVTSLHQGLADGTFSGHLTPSNSSPDTSIIITGGQFKNVPVVNP